MSIHAIMDFDPDDVMLLLSVIALCWVIVAFSPREPRS
jgi:hypothetical protein